METQWGLKLVDTPEQLKNYAGFYWLVTVNKTTGIYVFNQL